jgi:hypothetical protein
MSIVIMKNRSFYHDFFWKSMVFEGLRFQESSSPGESRPQALPETDVNLSAHPAPIDQPMSLQISALLYSEVPPISG